MCQTVHELADMTQAQVVLTAYAVAPVGGDLEGLQAPFAVQAMRGMHLERTMSGGWKADRVPNIRGQALHHQAGCQRQRRRGRLTLHCNCYFRKIHVWRFCTMLLFNLTLICMND